MWGVRNWLFLGAFLAAFPVLYLLFAEGEQHALTDQIGVAGSAMHWGLLNLALYPWDPARAGRRDASRF